MPNLVCGGEQGFGENDRMGIELRGKKMKKKNSTRDDVHSYFLCKVANNYH